jgi:hypothetical protein
MGCRWPLVDRAKIRVRVFPNDDAVSGLVTAVVVETRDEWAVAELRYRSQASVAPPKRTRGRTDARRERRGTTGGMIP